MGSGDPSANVRHGEALRLRLKRGQSSGEGRRFAHFGLIRLISLPHRTRQLPLQGKCITIDFMIRVAALEIQDRDSAPLPFWRELTQSERPNSVRRSLRLFTRWTMPSRVVAVFGTRRIPVAPP